MCRRLLLGSAAACAITVPVAGGGGPGLLAGLLAELVAGSSAFAADDALGAKDPPDKSFGAETVRGLAKRLSESPFQKPSIDVPEPFDSLTYDQYRDIRFRADKAVWRGEQLGYELQLFPLGYLYDVPVDVSVIENGRVRRLMADHDTFQLGRLFKDAPAQAPFAFSGFRVHGPLNAPDVLDEYAVFQGASYFRIVAKGQTYGLSARGLAVNTARPGGEEFPLFRAFWVQKPEKADRTLTVHALLDSKSVAGAYTFVISPGEATTVDVTATLYARRPLEHIGLAPLTSMYLHGPHHNRIPADFRPSVHDSEGLAILNGRGEHLWRPLTNPKTLQTSAFIDENPKGFGLSQRDRRFSNYEDLEAHYERRPTVWVEPKGNWGRGYVELIEIPAREEIHDNIVAYWKPVEPIMPGKPFQVAYRTTWNAAVSFPKGLAKILKTRVGPGPRSGTHRFIVDFAAPPNLDANALPNVGLSVGTGTTANLTTQLNPETGGIRVAFTLDPAGTSLVELRLGLTSETSSQAGSVARQVSETWLYRWTQS